MDTVVDLIKALASLLWPVFAFVVFCTFKNEIRDLLSRVRRGKLLGQEFELEERFDRLAKTTSEATLEVAKLPPSPNPPPEEKEKENARVTERVLDVAARSPKVALLALSTAIEQELKEYLAITGWVKEWRQLTSALSGVHLSALKGLEGKGVLPKQVLLSLKAFWDIRNRLVHEQNVTSDEILRAIDYGTTILRALQALPRETNVVYHPSVSIYEDTKCEKLIDGAKGVILETENPGAGGFKYKRIFPTTRSHFQKGKHVAWEWSQEHQFGAAWYRDPDSNEIKQGWVSSLESLISVIR